MPSDLHPQAKFDPIPPDLDLSALVEKTANFDYVIRIALDQIYQLGEAEFEKLVRMHVIVGGRPLVVEGLHDKLPAWLFSPAWLQENIGKKQEKVRDIGNSTDIPMTIGHYLNSMEKLTRQWTRTNFRDSKRQRLYLKDIDCPDLWQSHLASNIPQILFYLNDNIGEKGGPGAIHERNAYSQLVLGQGIAPAGDLMSSLPPEMRAENMMCYIGHEGTYTPAHREMCASLGQNIMVETSEDKKGELPGSSVWFMTESKDREVVSEYFLSVLGHDIEVENHFAQINAWKKAPFAVYVVEQKVGDFILIPPLAPHQVWNRGTRTMKAAWNRTTVDTLELALREAVPRARMVCRDEQYKNKAIVYYSLLKYYDQLKRVEQLEEQIRNGCDTESIRQSSRIRQLQRDFKRLFVLYTEVLVSEMFSSGLPQEKSVEFVPFDGNVTCSYCRCNIFNRFLTCKTCIEELDTGEEDTYDICMECYAMGRSCGCISNLKWVEQWQWPVLLQKYDDWRHMVMLNDGVINADSPPQLLEIARARTSKKSIAQVCQEQLKLRPWHDISKPVVLEPLSGGSDAEIAADDSGLPRRRSLSKRKQEMQKKSHLTCHVCRKQEPLWKLAACTTCTNVYCYGSLWRAFDLKPELIMQLSDWKCPKCLRICSCGGCRRITNPTMAQTPYRPKGTLLGHDTRLVADPRSVESLVNFSRTNLFWLKDGDDDASQSLSRMQKLVEKARIEKERDGALDGEFEINESKFQTGQNQSDSTGLQDQSHLVIDPLLSQSGPNLRERQKLIHASALADSGTINSIGRLSQYTEPRSADQEVTTYSYSYSFMDNHEQPSDFGSEFVAPTATMFGAQQSSYPEPNAKGERIMRLGYDQQADDDDQILFEDPEASILADQNITASFPIFPHEEGLNELKNKKRKRSNVTQATSDSGGVPVQSLVSQKKQKLNKAKRYGTLFMAQKQLDGANSLIVTLSMKNQKEFLHRLSKLDVGKKAARNNTVPSWTSITALPGNPDSEEDVRMSIADFPRNSESKEVLNVRPDLQEDVRPNGELQENIRTDDDSISIATEAIRNLRKQSPIMLPQVEEELQDRTPNRSRNAATDSPAEIPGNEELRSIANKSGSNRRLSDQLSRKSSQQSDMFPTAGPYSSMSRRQRVRFSDKKLEQPSAVEKGAILDRESQTAETVNCKSQLETMSKEPSVATLPSETSVAVESASFDQDDEFVMFDEEYNPIVQNAERHVQPVKPNTPTTMSSGYQSAKLIALRMAEGKIDHDSDARRLLKKVVSPMSSCKTSVMATKPAISPSSLISVPARTSPKYTSMAERRALQGKSFKIVAAKSSTNNSSDTNPNAAESKKRTPLGPGIVQKTPGMVHISPIERADSLEGDSTYDEEEEIPAIRPVAVKPGVLNPKVGGSLGREKLDGQRKGKTMFSSVK